MLNSLDLLVIAFMALAAASLLSLALMFLLKNRIARSVCFYVASAVGLYLTSIGLRIGIGGLFAGQIAVAVLTAILGIGILVLGIVERKNPKLFLISRIACAATTLVALCNAFFF